MDGNRASGEIEIAASLAGEGSRRSWVTRGLAPYPMHRTAPRSGATRHCIRLRWVGWTEDR